MEDKIKIDTTSFSRGKKAIFWFALVFVLVPAFVLGLWREFDQDSLDTFKTTVLSSFIADQDNPVMIDPVSQESYQFSPKDIFEYQETKEKNNSGESTGQTGGEKNAYIMVTLPNNEKEAGTVTEGVIQNGVLAPGAQVVQPNGQPVETEKRLTQGSVTNWELADGSVARVKIASFAVTEDKLADGSVTFSKIKDGTITNGKIEDGAITGDKIANDGSIVKLIKGKNPIEVKNNKDGSYTITLSGECSDDEILKWNTQKDKWVCAADNAGTSIAGTGGTVTSIATGNGLNGGTINVSGTLSVNSPICGGTDKLQWNGTAFICSADVDTDTDTTYTAGNGLSLIGNEFTANLLSAGGLQFTTGQLSLKLDSNTLTLGADGLKVTDNYDDNFLNTLTVFGGDVSGAYGSVSVTDDSHSHTAGTLPIATSYLSSGIESTEITDNEISEVDFKSSNDAGNGQILSYNSGTGGFTWTDMTGSKWTDSDTITYLTSTTDNVAIGGSTSSSPFYFDSTNQLLTLTNTTAGASFRVNDVASDTTPFLVDATGKVGVGTNAPTSNLHIVGDMKSVLYDGSATVDYDIMIGNQDGTCLAYENIGSPTSLTWSAKTDWNLADIGGDTYPAFADIDNDGDKDLFVGDGGGGTNGKAFCYRNTGTTSSPIWTRYTTWDLNTGSNTGATVPSFVDLDGDGDQDGMIGKPGYGTIEGYRNTGTSSAPIWTREASWDKTSGMGTGNYPAFADLDGDSDYDLIGGGRGYQNTGSTASPTWTYNAAWSIDQFANSPVALADLDADGDKDLFYRGTVWFIYGYKNTGSAASPTWTRFAAWDPPIVGVPWPTIAIADLDNDSAMSLNGGKTAYTVDFTNTKGDGTNAIYGIRITNPSSSTASSEYGVYIAGTNWDYSLYAESNVQVNGGLVVGAPTGGNKGAGTINATAIYDDDVQVTDYVFDKYFDGFVKPEDLPLAGTVTADGSPLQTGSDYTILTMDQMDQYVRDNRHLPTIPGRDEWNANGKFSLGKLVNHLWETTEVTSLYVTELNNANKAQDLKIVALENIGVGAVVGVGTGNSPIQGLEDENGKKIEELEERIAVLENGNNKNTNTTQDDISISAEEQEQTTRNENLNTNSDNTYNSDSSDNSSSSDTNADSKSETAKEETEDNSISAWSEFKDSILTIVKDVIVKTKATFGEAVTFLAEATFGDKVTFKNRVTYEDKDMGGFTKIKEGEKEVKVVFKKAFKTPPIVNVTPQRKIETVFWVEAGKEDFKIILAKEADKETTFSWSALAVENPDSQIQETEKEKDNEGENQNDNQNSPEE